ncbi:hypothetical protein [Candidatus Leptofilum sp.]|uniref:tetratricopeptide repeat protein n=1 Tax=Candidatus Leptofilum sp. TaxID=3241576 RepID=UPI003B59A0B1
MDEGVKLKLAPPTFHGRRHELAQIIEMATSTRPNHGSSVLLLEGPGGMGKSMLVRQATDELEKNHSEIYVVGPLDMDDTNYHIASNVGLQIAHKLGEKYFTRYIEANRKYQGHEIQAVDRTTIHIHLALGDRYFVEDYSRFARKNRVVIFADTVETIRGTHIWSYFSRMIASLPNTLFVLSGRRSSPYGLEKRPFSSEKERFGNMPNIGKDGVDVIQLQGWPKQEARAFIANTSGGSTLLKDDIERLLYLSRCQPLHLTLALQHLPRMPVLDRNVAEIKQTAPLYANEFDATIPAKESLAPDIEFDDLGDEGKSLVTQFNRELLLHMADSSPLSQTMRRIAHLRRRIDKEMYARIVTFSPAIRDAPTWDELIKQPWVRKRTGGYVTWHDIVGELLRKHIWPIRDSSGKKRKLLSQQAITLYTELIKNLQVKINKLNSKYDLRLKKINEQEGDALFLEEDFPELVELTSQLLELRRRLWPIEAEKLYYELDADVQAGYQAFLRAFNQAGQAGQLIVRELFLSEMEPFLQAFEPGSNEYFEIVFRQIQTAVGDNLQDVAAEKIAHLWDLYRDPIRQYQLLIWQGNTFLRTVGRETEGRQSFEAALQLAKEQEELGIGEALSEIGFAHRQLGNWEQAGKMYREALKVTPLSKRDLRAEIGIQLAYVQALLGEYDAANAFMRGTLPYLRQFGDRILFGAGLSVQGEVFRYQKKYDEAHKAYDEALAVFSEIEHLGWLGTVQQEKAICLIQENNPRRNLLEAMYLIEQARYFCREQNMRDYPSALNRAGRIYELKGDYEQAFTAFEEGIEVAQAAQNIWFLMSNIIEFSELAVQLWHDTEIPEHHEKILKHESLVKTYDQNPEYEFKDLFGRWHLVKGHKAWYEGKQAVKHNKGSAEASWQTAMEEYALGFSMVAQGYYGSHGIGALPKEGERLKHHVLELPVEEGKRWCNYFHQEWGELDDPAVLQGIVEDIYQGVSEKEQASS